MSTTNISTVEETLDIPEDATYIGGVDLNPQIIPIEEEVSTVEEEQEEPERFE